MEKCCRSWVGRAYFVPCSTRCDPPAVKNYIAQNRALDLTLAWLQEESRHAGAFRVCMIVSIHFADPCASDGILARKWCRFYRHFGLRRIRRGNLWAL